MVLPVANSLVYAEPIYLQATQSKLPELKRVILSHNDKIIMSESLDEGIQRLLGVSTTTKISDYAPTQTPSSDSPSTMDQWVDRLISVHRRIRSSLEALDFKAFGSALDELDQSVHHIQTLKEEE